jgi:Ca2+-binding EF-hand superfamily protein
MSEKDVAELLETADFNGRDQISYEEFLELMNTK